MSHVIYGVPWLQNIYYEQSTVSSETNMIQP